MTSIDTIWQFDLRRGNSKNPRDGACLLDAVSWFEYGRLGDHPVCVCPVFAVFGRGVNDAMSDAGRQRLKIYIPRLIGTVDKANEQERAEYLAWQAVRVFAPLALETVGMKREASSLRNFSGSLDEAARAAWAAAWAARAAAAAARAAWAAERAAAARAAWAAARAAAAAEAATWAAEAARAAAAEVAAWAAEAARAAVEDAIIATFDGMLAIGRQAEPIEIARITEVNRLFEIACVS